MVSVAVLGDSPTLTTGFGRTTGRIAQAIAAAGPRVAVFGMKALPEDVDGWQGDYEIAPANARGHWTDALPGFFAETEPAVLVMNMDAFNAVECLRACESAGWAGPTVSYVCFDGLPEDPEVFAAQRRCAGVWTTTRVGRGHLEANGVEVAGIAPPGVDPDRFHSGGRAEARRRAGLEGTVVVGVFGTNTRRKQLGRALLAFAAARERMTECDLRLYMHCDRAGYWDLGALIEEHGLERAVAVAGSGSFDERRGLDTLSYRERLSCCDVIVNVPDSGDVEQVILEAQACGVPLVHTADDAMMSEAMADGALAVKGVEMRWGRVDEPLHLVDPADVADAMIRILRDRALADRLRDAGTRNVERYGWDNLEQGARHMVKPFATLSAR